MANNKKQNCDNQEAKLIVLQYMQWKQVNGEFPNFKQFINQNDTDKIHSLGTREMALGQFTPDSPMIDQCIPTICCDFLSKIDGY